MLLAVEEHFDRAIKEPGADVQRTSEKSKREGKKATRNKIQKVNQTVYGVW